MSQSTIRTTSVFDNQDKREVTTTKVVGSAEGVTVGRIITTTDVPTIADVGTLLSSPNAGATSITLEIIPGLVAGQTIKVIQDGAGIVTFLPGTSVTINGGPAVAAQDQIAVALYRGADTWTILDQ